MKDITDQEVLSLTAAIKNRYDLDFTCYEMGSLKRRVSRSLSIFEVAGTHELWIRVLREEDFIKKLVNELSVGLTSMFRDIMLWQKLRTVVKELIDQKGSINVWHAGCSTGEEVYTFNILLRELGLANRVKSLATDMNTDAIAAAQSGQYNLLKIKEYRAKYEEFNPSGDFAQYCSYTDEYGQMDTGLLKNVTFMESNLITDDIRGEFDIIFCRNVMIYFDRIAKKNVLNKFHSHLAEEGLFIIGFFDSLINVIDKSRFDYFDLSCKIFQKTHSVKSSDIDELTFKKINLLIHLAGIDKEFHRSEKLLIDEIIRAEGLNPNDFRSSEGDEDLEFLSALENKMEMLYHILSVMKADGQITPSELRLSKKIANLMGFEDDVIEKYAYGNLPAKESFICELKVYHA